MIKLHITFENKNKDAEAEDTVVSAKFNNMNDIHKWLDRISGLNEDSKLKRTPGFITQKGETNVDSPTR